jgi:uncharacterized protein YjbI with pentapeptide repeats
MANHADLNALRAGVSAWNAWRSKHGDDYLDLSGIDLSINHFRHATGGDDPFDAYLEQVIFRRTNLSQTRINWTFVRDADFSEANLRHADLQHSRFVRVNFDRADLSGADLRGAELIETDLSDAILDGAVLDGATADGQLLTEVGVGARSGLDPV